MAVYIECIEGQTEFHMPKALKIVRNMQLHFLFSRS